MIKKLLKKILIICALIILVLICFGAVNKSNASEVVDTWDVSAEDGKSHVIATLYLNGKLVLDGTGKMKDYSYKTYKQIPYNSKKSDIKEIEIKNGVTSIGAYAFYECSNLTGNLVIPDSVTSIGDSAFDGCSGLTGNLVIPDSVTSIGDSAFYECSGLNGNLVIGNSVTKIGPFAFSECGGLTGNLVIGNSVTEIGDYAFSECRGLTGNLVIPDSVISIGDCAFDDCGLNGNLVIGNSVTKIGALAFSYCLNLTGNLVIGNSVTEIGEYAFSGCKGFTENLIIPDSVTSIGERAFYSCSGLTNINVDNNNKNYSSENGILFNKEKTILVKCPEGIQIENYHIPETVLTICDSAFWKCSGLTGNLVIGNSVTEIGDYAFSECRGLTGNLVIPDSVTSIGDRAFDGCSGLTGNLVISDNVIYIGEDAFIKCTGLTSINVAINNKNYSSESGILFNKEKTILIKCPEGIQIENYHIPDTVTIINASAFNNCSDITGNLVIPDSVTSIGGYAFSGCTLTIVITCNEEDNQEIELPDIIKRAMIEDDILYSENGFTLNNCVFNEDNTKLIVNNERIKNSYSLLSISSGKLKGLSVKIVLSGTVKYKNIGEYNNYGWTKRNVLAILYLADGERVINNEGKNTYTFEKNGEFIFTYLDINNNERQVIAKVDNIEEFSLEEYEKTRYDNNNIIEKILPNTTVSSFIKKVKTNGTIKILKNDQEITNENDLICTGMTMKVSWGNNEEIIYTTIVTGDLTGNGKMGIGDLSKLSRYAAGMDETLTGVYLRASDVVKDGKYGRISDLSKMSRVLAGMDNF